MLVRLTSSCMTKIKKIPAVPNFVAASVQTAISRFVSRDLGLKPGASDEELEFARIKCGGRLDTPDFQEKLANAVKKRDAKFFSHLGEALKEVAGMKLFLIKNWLPLDDQNIGFCHLSDPLLTKVLSIYYQCREDEAFKPDAVRKTWSRLGLKKVHKSDLYVNEEQLPDVEVENLPAWDPKELVKPTILERDFRRFVAKKAG